MTSDEGALFELGEAVDVGAAVDDATTPPATDHDPLRGQRRLSRIEVFNWGTFGQGYGHVVDVPRGGLVVTGRSGSGKSSLLDAVSTVLVARSQIRYNAAAQDTAARSGDRSLLSYVRGAWKRAETDGEEIAAEYLRPGATWSAILLRFDTADGAPPVVLAKIFHAGRGTAANADVKEAALLLTEDARIEDFAPFAQNGVDIRALKRHYGSTAVFERHAAFQAKYRRRLGLDKDAAVGLLHRTMAAKNFSSLDALFREFMLDVPDTFQLAERAVEQFDQLSQAHRSVVEAREQLELLTQLREAAVRFEESEASARELEALTEALVPTVWRIKEELTAARLQDLVQEISAQQQALEAGVQRHAAAQSAHDSAHAMVQGLGGDRLRIVEEEIVSLERQRVAVAARRERLRERAARVGIEGLPDTLAEFHEFRQSLSDTRAQEEAREAKRAQTRRRHAEADALTAELKALHADVTSARKAHSNIDRKLLEVRTLISEETGIDPAALPFAGELLEVDPDHQEWTGAIERVLRPLALTLLVEARNAAAVTDAVDSRHLGVRLVVQEVAAEQQAARGVKDERSLVHRVRVKDDRRFAPWLHRTLSQQYDYACVDSARELRSVERGLTRAGQVRSRGGRFEKDDRFRIDDRRRWVLGFSAEEKISRLLDEAARTKSRIDAAQALIREAEQLEESASQQLRFAEEVQDLEWEEIDTGVLDLRVTQRRNELDALTAESPQLEAARADLARRRKELEGARQAHSKAEADLRVLVLEQTDVAEKHRRAAAQVAAAAEVDDAVAEQVRARIFDDRRRLRADEVDGRAGAVRAELNKSQNESIRAANHASTEFAARSTAYQERWPASVAGASPAVEDRAVFEQRRQEIAADALPAYENRFLEMLSTQSVQNIGQLSRSIQQAPKQIRMRIEPVTDSLSHSEFDAGRWLQIDVQPAQSADVRDFLRDLTAIAAGFGQQLGTAEADRKFELLRAVIGRLGSSENRRWRDAVLDTRRHVTFRAREVDAHGTPMDVYSSSQGLSGGQRQKLVTFCLAAALRYQLTQDAADVPEYGTVILDEAFDRADEAFTRMALEVFLDFGFHMVLATPMKMLRTLELYVEGVALVESEERRRSRIRAIVWDEGRALQ
jgi:uncharacterized protein YPO0396